MQHRLLGQLKGPRGYAYCALDAPVPAGTGQEWAGPVRGALELERSGEVYTAHGRLEATVVVACSRCTLPHPVRLPVEVDETVALEQIDEPASFLEGEGDMASCPPIPILSGDTLDLSELVRQMLILAVPPRSLCRPECRGLCPHCGADLNREQCSCAERQVDPRLEALRKLL
jgi:uncharacterized protein